jgi:hypothetical protein
LSLTPAGETPELAKIQNKKGAFFCQGTFNAIWRFTTKLLHEKDGFIILINLCL